MSEFTRAQVIDIYQLFVNQKGEESTITGTPTIEIKFFNGSTFDTILAATSMTQVSGNLFTFRHTVSNSATFGEYVIIYSAVLDGISGTGSESFQVERYIKDTLLKKTATYLSNELNKYEVIYSRDEFATTLERSDIDFTYNVDRTVNVITGDEETP